MVDTGRRLRRGRAWILCGLLAGAVGSALLVASAVLASDAPPGRGAASAVTGLRDVLHSPPLLIARGSPTDLRFETVCQRDELGTPCHAAGTLFVRPHGERNYRRVALRAEGLATLTADVPAAATAGTGFAYYAVIDDGLGGSRTVPTGGSAAPLHVWVTEDEVRVDLGLHEFGRVREPDRSRVRAPWGGGDGEVGLLRGKELVRIGPSAFDIAPDGSVVVLDQINDRLAVYAAAGGGPRYVSVPFGGAEGDLAVADDGVMHVLDHGVEQVVRSVASTGAALETVRVSARGGDMLRATPGGPMLHGYPGDLWFPVRQGARPLSQAEQASRARPGLDVGGGLEAVVRAGNHQVALALVAGDRVVKAWTITSTTGLGEIQLVEPYADGLLVVVRLWTEARAEFVALQLSSSRLVRSFSAEADEWAESAALSRFKLDGGRLYQLRSTPVGVEVVSFDLGGSR